MKQRIIALVFTFIGFQCGLKLFDLQVVPIHAQAPHGTVSEEVPRGAIDGANATFTLNFQPAPWGSIHVYRNGLRQQRNNDFTLGGLNHTQVIFNVISTPQPGDILLVDYTY